MVIISFMRVHRYVPSLIMATLIVIAVAACGGSGTPNVEMNNSSTNSGFGELAECPDGDVLLSHFPLNEGDHGFITPLGFLMPPAHVFPTMHMYVQVNGTEYQSNGMSY